MSSEHTEVNEAPTKPQSEPSNHLYYGNNTKGEAAPKQHLPSTTQPILLAKSVYIRRHNTKQIIAVATSRKTVPIASLDAPLMNGGADGRGREKPPVRVASPGPVTVVRL